LKAGATVGSTNPADYMQVTPDPNCTQFIHFCAIQQPQGGSTLVIGNPSALRNDLVALQTDPNGNHDTSNQIEYKDPN
jgi:hypothetical protein